MRGSDGRPSAWALALGLVVLVPLFACGGSSSEPAPLSSPLPLVTASFTLDSGFAQEWTVTLPASGNLHASILGSGSSVDLYFTPASCPSAFSLTTGQCTVLTSQSAGSDLFAYEGPGSYKAFALNYGPGQAVGSITLEEDP